MQHLSAETQTCAELAVRLGASEAARSFATSRISPSFNSTDFVALRRVVEPCAVEVGRAMEDAGGRAKLAEIGASSIGARPAETMALHRQELAKFRRAVGISGAKAE